MGHEIGDHILSEVSRLIQNMLDSNDFFARFGGDEFVLLLHNSDIEHIDTFAERLIQAFKHPFKINEIDFFLSLSIGIVLYPQDASNTEDLIRHADTAMYEAKKKGKNLFVYYDVSMQ